MRPGTVAFVPQYPLWSDGSTKRRWMRLPPGTSIDASDPDAWDFPRGTKLWKEFSAGRRVETRYVERLPDGSWRFATYLWNAEGTEAVLAPARGRTLAVDGAPGGRYAVPSRADCLACHDAGAVPVLGVSALQLSPDRDPLAPHAERPRDDHADLRALVDRGLVRGLPASMLDSPPRIASADPVERAALGYLHGNCGQCHDANGALAGLDLALKQSAADPRASARASLDSLVGRASRFRKHDAETAQRIVAGSVEDAVLLQRMRSTHPLTRMPPLGTSVVDDDGVALLERWIRQLARENAP